MTIAEQPPVPITDESPDDAADSPELTEFERLAQRVDDARRAAAELNVDDAGIANELGDAVEAFHRPALVTMVQTLRADPRGKELLFQLVDDPHVRSVFALHGIIRADPATRAERALDTIRPYLSSHGGGVQLVSVVGAVATVKLTGSCNGCSMSTETLRSTVTEALVTHVDEVTTVEVAEEPAGEPTQAFIPVEALRRRTPAETGWVDGGLIEELQPGRLHRLDVPADAHGPAASFVVTIDDAGPHVFENSCVHQGRSLDGGLMGDGVITCPWHGFTFDAASGECISSPGAQLTQVPSRIDGGRLLVRARTP